MSDNISATEPKFEWLRKLSEMLRSGGEKVSKYEPSALPLVSGMIKGTAKSLDNWNYGDPMFDLRANTPLVNDNTLDMLSTLPVGAATKGAAAVKAGIFPAIPALFAATNPLRAKWIEKQVRLADELRAKDAPMAEIVQKTGLVPNLGQTGATTPAKQAKWSFITASGRFDDVLNDSKHKLGNVLDDPEAFRLLPALRDVDYATGNKVSTPVTGRAHYMSTDGPQGEIAIANNTNNEQFTDPFSLMRTQHHELDHVIQKLTDQVGTTGYQASSIAPYGESRIPGLIAALENNGGQEDLVRQLRLRDTGGTRQSFLRNHALDAGERNANVAGDMAVREARDAKPGREVYPVEPQNLVGSNVSRALSHVLSDKLGVAKKVDDEGLRYVLNEALKHHPSFGNTK